MAPCLRSALLCLCCSVLIFSVRGKGSGVEKTAISGAEIDRSVLAALTRQGATKLKIISHVDLTRPFQAASQWTFVAVQEAQPVTEGEEQGPVHICFVRARAPDCSNNLYHQAGTRPPYDLPYHLFASTVVYAAQNQSSPLLLLQLCTDQMFDGNCGVATGLYRYDRGANRFVRVFENLTGRNNNEATRFVADGPLQGDILVDYPTANAPYTYWIEVYRANGSGMYVRVLRYRGSTRYGDRNQLTVTDSEMPSILSHFGFWKPGDPPPAPPHLPRGCSRLYMQGNEEWCK